MTKSGPELVRAIGRWSLLALTVNSMIGSGIYGLPSVLTGLAGKGSTWVVLMTAIAIGVIIACFAEVASYFADAGGPYLYGRVAFGRLIGILVGWTLFLAQAAAPAANANLFVIYLAEFWPHAKQPWIRIEILTALIGVLTVINLIGVRQGTRASNAFTVAKILPLLMVIVAGTPIAFLHPAPFTSMDFSSSDWLKAMALLFFIYGGFESALAPASEAKHPKRDVAFALLGALAVCAAIFALVQWVVVAVLGSGAATDRPLAEVARLTMGERGAQLVSIGAMLSVYGYLSAKLLGMPRLTFAFAEQGDLPAFFARISRRFHTPWVSILVYAFIIWGLSMSGNFRWNVTLSVIARLFYYAVTCAALIVLRRKSAQPPWFRLPGGAVLAVLGILICSLLLPSADMSKSPIVAAAFAAGLLNWIWARRKSTPISGDTPRQT